MNLQCLAASDIIAMAAVFIAVVVPIIQIIYERRREWHESCELLFRSLDSLYTEIKELALVPNKVNHISYQQYLNQRVNLLAHYGKRFFFQKKRIKAACNKIVHNLMDIPVKIEYEELIIKGYKSKKDQDKNYLNFIQEIRTYTVQASEALIK